MKKIVCLIANDFTYEVGKTPVGMEDLVVTDIYFKRDGYQGINQRDESHYIIRIEDDSTGKDVVFKLIPAIRMTESMFIEVAEKEKKENACEQPTNDLTIA
ncbi:hypothetical protein LCGC14_0682530 [marine sediment metagenome]|uniref:Uncharacterized protein n=1 Tax=marine sediment metagenome TaxID=412755 RepID=A0A0F9QSR1_9ZZZZ